MPNTIQRPEDWPMELYHGDDWPPEAFAVVDDAATPLTGFSVKSQVKDADGNIVKTLIGGSGFTIVNNVVTFNSTVDIPAGQYEYDIQVTLSNGKIHTQYAGFITVTADVTS